MPAHHHDMDMMGAPSPAASTESPMPPMAMEEVEHVMTGMRHGTYEGHALAGSLLIVWGAWWTVCFLQRFYSSYLHKVEFKSAAWYRTDWLFRNPSLSMLEPIFKLTLPILGVFDEIVPWDPLFAADGKMNHEPIHGIQHALMYVVFMLSGLADLLTVWFPDLPPGLDYVFLSLGSFCQVRMGYVSDEIKTGILLVFHLTGPALDQRLHLLLTVACFMTWIVILLEMRHRNSVLLTYLRCVTMMLQGSFWIQTGSLSFHHPAFDSNEGVAISAVIFLMHLLSWMTLLLAAMVLGVWWMGPQVARRSPKAAGAKGGMSGEYKSIDDLLKEDTEAGAGGGADPEAGGAAQGEAHAAPSGR